MKTFKELLREKVYRVSGDTKTPVGGKIAQAFKKKIETMKHVDDTSTLKELNQNWQSFCKSEGKNIVLDFVKKSVGKFDNVVVGIDAVLEKATWVKAKGNGNSFSLNTDFVINVSFFDDVNAKKFSKKMKGWVNSPMSPKGTVIFGEKPTSSLQNIEIRDTSFLLLIDQK